ncbi:hypothetical protein B0T14DRAFT_404440, partial [Immersiella caudata]
SAIPTGPAPSGLAPLTSRRLISVSGPDAEKYLHGVITANLLTSTEPASPPSGLYAAFLTAQGRVLHDVFIYRDTTNLSDLPSGPSPATTFLIEVDSSEADRLTRHIKRYKLRANFTVRPLPFTTIYHAWSDSASLTLPSSLTKSTITLSDPRLPGLGHRLLVPEGASTPSLDGIPPVSEAAYHLRRYLNGIPEGQSEIVRENALPQESNIDLLGAIDFRKGCYVGQELTIRTKHRGVVRKRILPVMLYGAGHAPPAEMVYRPEVEVVGGEQSVERLRAEMVTGEVSIGRVGKKGRSAGKWLKGMGNVGLALCRLEIMTGLSMLGEQAMASGAFQEGDEFVVGVGEREEGQEVRVKAFVPEWMRAGLEGGDGH